MAAKVVLIALALIIAVGLSTWALAWAYGKYVESKAGVEKARYARDEAMVDEAERESREGDGT